MRKRIISFATALVLSAGLLGVPAAAAENEIKVNLNGTELVFDVPPQNIDGRIMVPMRGIFEALGAEVNWDASNQTIFAAKDDASILMQIDNPVMSVDDEQITLDVSPMLVDSRTVVPVRAVAEGFNAEVNWDRATQTVSITTGDVTPVQKEQGNSYTSKSLNLSFTAPEGYELTTGGAGSALEDVLGLEEGVLESADVQSGEEMTVSSDEDFVFLNVSTDDVELDSMDEAQYMEIFNMVFELAAEEEGLNFVSNYSSAAEAPVVEVAGQNYKQLTMTLDDGETTLAIDCLLRKTDDGKMVMILGAYLPESQDKYNALLGRFTEYQPAQ